MAKPLIIAVGGSGQTVVSHYLRYATMAGISGNDLPDIFILDADLKESVRGRETKSSLYGEIDKLHKRLAAGLSESNKPRLEHLYPYSSGTSIASQQTFGEYLIGSGLGGADKDRKPVLNGLFDKPEQEIQIAEGFFARPNVGATAIFDKLFSEQKDQTLTLLQRAVRQPDPPRVVVIGSTFGGTGSGGTPVIAQQLRSWAGDTSKIRIGVFLTLPWFSPGDLGKTFTDTRDTQGKWETQVRNTAAGMRFYGTSAVFLNHVDVFLADYNGEKHKRWDDSNTGQPEYPHCFNLILAAQIQNYLTRDIPTNEDPRQYSFYFLAPSKDRGVMKLDGHDCALLRFNAGELRQDLADWAKQTQTVRLVLGKIADYINQGFKLEDAGVRDRPQKFLDLVMALAQTCGHLQNPVVKTGILKKPDASRQVYANLAKALDERAQQLAHIVAWLREAWEQSNKNPSLAPQCLDANPLQIWDNYPALTPERNAEVGAIKVFNRAFERAGSIVAEFHNRVEKAHQEPFHAASELIETLLRKAILEIGGSGPRKGDEQQPAVPHGLTTVALLPIQIAGSPRDHYALPVGLEEILDHGRTREGQLVGIFDEKHPATLAGISHYNIPSPWAAAHLNAWIQRYGYVRDGNPPALWREAKDSLAAILWALFNKRLRIHAVPYKNLSRLGKVLQGSLNAELFGYDGVKQLEKIVYASDADGRTIAINHPLCGWFPAPDLQKEQRWWEMLGYELPTEVSVTDPESIKAGQLRAFRGYLENLLAKSSQDDSADPAGWYPAVGALVAELHAKIPKGAQSEPVTTTEDGFHLLDKSDKSIFRIAISVLKESGLDIVDEYCVSTVAVLRQAGDFRAADLPLRSKFLSLDGIGAQLLGISRDAQGKPTTVRYRLTLSGRGSFEIERPARVIDPFLVHAEIWPNFKMADWRFYFLGSFGDPRYLDKFKGTFSLFDSQGQLIGDAHRSFAHNHEVHGVPEYLVFELPDEHPEIGVFRINLEAIPEGGDRLFNLALDFGTSHSCVYAATTAGKRIDLDFSEPSLQLGKAIFVHEETKTEIMITLTRFLSCYVSLAQTSDKSVLPSELRSINFPTPRDLGSGIRSFVIIPMRFKKESLSEMLRKQATTILGGFKWPGEHLSGNAFERQEPGLTKEYLLQILRIAAALLRKNDYKKLQTFRVTFPEAFSHAQRRRYAELVGQVFSSLFKQTGIEFQSEDQHLSAERLLATTSTSIAGRHKAPLDQNYSGMVSESIAALLSASSTDYDFFADRGICIVLDMGGGTTDVAAYVSQGSGRRDARSSIESITDSIRYAGHDLLRLLAQSRVLDDLRNEQDTVHDNDEDARIHALKILVRDDEHFERLKQNFSYKDYLPETKEQMILFFTGLFEYTRLLIQLYRKAMHDEQTKSWVVNIALFGNAWKLAELVYPTREYAYDGFIEKFQNYLQSALTNGETIHIRYESLPDYSIKEATAVGALKLNPADPKFLSPKEHTSMAGIKVRCHKNNGDDIEVDGDEFLTGFDREGYDNKVPLTVRDLENLRERPFLDKLRARYKGRDDAWITAQVASAIDQAIRKEWIVPGITEDMKFSPMGLFLEKVWKETIRAAVPASIHKDKLRK